MKKKLKKRCLSILLLLVMLITLFPVNIMATENENQNIVKMSTDITAPTGVSVVSFVENGQTVKNGDDIHFIITAQDTESDISAEKSMEFFKR